MLKNSARWPIFNLKRLCEHLPKSRVNISSDLDRGRFGALALKAITQPKMQIRDGSITISSSRLTQTASLTTGSLDFWRSSLIHLNYRKESTWFMWDVELADRARRNVSYLPHVQVIEGDGGETDPGLSDAILINAGVTHPRSIWLDSLRPDGRLLIPLTVTDDTDRGGAGRILKITRQPEGFMASFISEVGIFSCVGGRDTDLNQRLKEAFERDDWKSVQSLRREKHEPSNACWFHGETFCLSKMAVSP
jgi:hypothetical protein